MDHVDGIEGDGIAMILIWLIQHSDYTACRNLGSIVDTGNNNSPQRPEWL
jgi:hypothetical protein